MIHAGPKGFEPADVLPAILETGFVAPDAAVGLEVTARGVVTREGGDLFLQLPETRWKLAGKGISGLNGALQQVVRLTGTLLPGTDGESPSLRDVLQK